MNALFISYDGMTDPLGQSQVIPYLAGLVRKGHSITLLSCEKEENFVRHKDQIQQFLKDSNIDWHPIKYRKNPPVLSTLMDVRSLTKTAKALHKKKSFDIIHCRSYIAALVGLKMKRKFGTKFIFDMRGFWADERVDGNLWSLSNPVFRRVYNYFKKKEIAFLSEADYTISLTKNAKDEIHSWNKVRNQPVPIEVIPCCVDLGLFNPEAISQTSSKLRTDLGFTQETFILSYIGSIGTWYLLDEMLDFFVELKKRDKEAIFLFVTKDSPEFIIEHVRKKSELTEKDIRITSSERSQVPSYIAVSDLSVFFIKPVFSKKASSPTKQGEIMAMNIPVICNGNVGDTDYVIEHFHSGILVKEFSTNEYNKALDEYFDKFRKKEHLSFRTGAKDFYALEKGIELYDQTYRSVIKK